MYRLLRWLLVALLPFIGLYVGSSLTPTLKPKWEMTFPNPIAGLGLVDEDHTFLLGELRKGGTGLTAIVGIDKATGAQQFRHELPSELQQSRYLASRSEKLAGNGTALLFYHDSTKNIMLYDWKKHQILHKYRCNSASMNTNEAVLKDKTLVAFSWNTDAAGFAHSFMVIWDIHSEVPRYSIEVGQQAIDLNLSEDGMTAAINTTTSANVNQVAIVDTVQGKIIQKINGYYSDVRWSDDSQHLYLLAKLKQVVIQPYERRDEGYVPTSEVIVSAPPIHAGHARHHFVFRSFNGYHPLRRKVAELLGNTLEPVMNRLWPITPVINVHDPKSGERLRSLKLPNDEFGTAFFPDQALDGMIIPLGQTVAYWPYGTPPSWPLWSGFFIGLLLATLLAWQTLRRPPHAARPQPI